MTFDLSALHATFVAADQPRLGYFALWIDDASRHGMFATPLDAQPVDPQGEASGIALWNAAEPATEPVLLYTGTDRLRDGPLAVDHRRLGIGSALAVYSQFHHSASHSDTVTAWARIITAGLQFVAARRLRPSVGPDGYDVWRCGPFDPAERAVIERLSESMPALGCAVATGPGGRQVPSRRQTVTDCWDAIADWLPRSDLAERIAASHLFVSPSGTKVPHLRYWARRHGSMARPGRLWTLTVADDAGQHFGARISPLGSPNEFPIERLRALRELARLWPPAEPFIQSIDAVVEIDTRALDDAIELTERLEHLGVTVRVDGDETIEEVHLALVPDPTSDQRGATRLSLQAGSEALSPSEAAAVRRSDSSVVRLGDRWFRVPELVRQLMATTPAPLSDGHLARGLIEGEFAASFEATTAPRPRAVGRWLEFQSTLRYLARLSNPSAPASEIPTVATPGLEATLRPYQRRGVMWLTELIRHGLGGCLADDMGLGKTLQVIAAHKASRTSTDGGAPLGPSLVVCPTSLIGNWEREIRRFAPDTEVWRFHGSQRHLPEDFDSRWPGGDAIVLTTYGVLRQSVDEIAGRRFGLVVADEAQNIKNPRSSTARLMRRITGVSRIALTGTPVENRLLELWAIMDWALPDLFNTQEQFRRRFAIPIERDRSKRAAERMNHLLAPFLMRRTKNDPGVADDLPDKIETDQFVALTVEQRKLYEQATGPHLERVFAAEGIERRGHVLALLTALKQITNHPAQFLKQSGPLPGRGSKLELTAELVESARLDGEATLIFTQYVKMAELIIRHLDHCGHRVGLLSGRLSPSAREHLVDQFQRGDLDALVLSLRAGGTGLNLTAASQVVHYDRWWNPAVEDQASDRAHRIGQTKTVRVLRLITAGTIEERIAEVLADKRRIAESVGAGGDWIYDLTDRELAALVRLTSDDDPSVDEHRGALAEVPQ